jgi:hypothetical protein
MLISAMLLLVAHADAASRSVKQANLYQAPDKRLLLH